MSFYQQRILPWLIDRGMRNKVMAKYRPRIPPLAEGRVLEVGVGAGLNFPYYTGRVRHLFGLEPADALREAAAEAAETMPFPVTLIGSGAENIPLETGAIDTVVSTWTLCSIPEVDLALREMRRVLKPDGRLIFMEHGQAPDADVARLQDRVAPALRLLAGCTPNRRIERLIRDAGFSFVELEKTYLDGPRFIAYHYVGEARPAQ
jgi:ubiquinone/menaquinone biosynthesis C-methylase UbiE